MNFRWLNVVASLARQNQSELKKSLPLRNANRQSVIDSIDFESTIADSSEFNTIQFLQPTKPDLVRRHSVTSKNIPFTYLDRKTLLGTSSMNGVSQSARRFTIIGETTSEKNHHRVLSGIAKQNLLERQRKRRKSGPVHAIEYHQ